MTLLILSCFIAGLPYRNPNLFDVALKDEVKLKPDPTNQYDPSAIEVWHKDQMLGFVPREITPVIHGVLIEGLPLRAWIEEMPMIKWKEIIIQAEVEIEESADHYSSLPS